METIAQTFFSLHYGKLCWAHPIDANPKKVTREMAEIYGVGTFLLAGSEMVKLIDK